MDHAGGAWLPHQANIGHPGSVGLFKAELHVP